MEDKTLSLRRYKLLRRDYKTIIRAAIKGMHFDWYIDNKWLQKFYGRYFLYSALLDATNIYVAYYGNKFAGLMLLNMNGEKKACKSFAKSLHVKFFDFLERQGEKSLDVYDNTNETMLANYEQNNEVDGEISFLAANPDLHIKGVGRFLLDIAKEDLKGKRVYLFSDNSCNYGFYDHMGFKRADTRKINLELPKGNIPMECYLFAKTF